MGLRQPRLGASTKAFEAVHRSERITGSVALWRGKLKRKCGERQGEGVAMMIERRVTVIEDARVERVHEAHEVAVTGRHDGHEET